MKQCPKCTGELVQGEYLETESGFNSALSCTDCDYVEKEPKEQLRVDEKGLPEYAFVVNEFDNNEVVMVYRGVMGYFPTLGGNQPWYGQETADIINADHGITKAQAKAMLVGSMYGWHGPAANPAHWEGKV